MLSRSSGYAYGTGTTAVTVNIPYVPMCVPVIDTIMATTINGTIDSAATLTVGGTIIERFQMPTAVPRYFTTQLSNGFPHWRLPADSGWGWSDSVNSHEPGGGLVAKQMLGDSGAPNAFLGQSFTTVAAYTITSVWVYMRAVGRPTDDSFAVLHSTSISGADIATSENVSLITIPKSPGWVEYRFQTPVALAAATKYYLHLERVAPDAANYPEVFATTDSSFAGGGLYIFGTGAWSAESATDDMMFRTTGHLPIILTLPASSTGSYLGVMYHYAKPSHLRD